MYHEIQDSLQEEERQFNMSLSSRCNGVFTRLGVLLGIRGFLEMATNLIGRKL